MYTLEQLFDFSSIVKYGGYRKASENIHKSQPAISLSIKKLEEFLGFDLFVKKAKKTTLTPQGEVFYKSVEKILIESERAINTSRVLKLGGELRIRICVDALIPVNHFLAGLRKFKDKFPYTSLTLTFESFDIALRKLEQDECDLALCALYDTHADFQTEVLGKTQIISVSADKKLAKSGELKDFENSTQIVLSGTSINKANNFNILENSQKWLTYDNRTKLKLIKNGLGWGAICDYDAHELLKDKIVYKVQNSSLAPQEFELFAVNRIEKQDSAEYQLLKDIARDSFNWRDS
jgi:DNA-binding transcriptional LysR family regulator